MNSLVSKIGVTLAALALVIAPALTPALAAGINVSITSPVAGANVTVNQPFTFAGSATGGTVADYAFNWVLGGTDGQAASVNSNGQTSISKTLTTVGSRTITLNVNDASGHNGTQSVTVNVVPASTDSKPVISNVLVASKTQTTATITWTTDIDATSRVIYGLTSQKDPVTGKEIGSAPNYNYTNSEPASVNSSSPKTKSHSVTLTGLTPGTKYYFRVLSAK